jgi:hypothetical protein
MTARVCCCPCPGDGIIPGHDPGVVTSAKVSVGVPQLSVAVGVVHVGVPVH